MTARHDNFRMLRLPLPAPAPAAAPRLLLLLLLLLLSACCGTIPQVGAQAAGASAAKKPTVAIIDEKFFHLEVVAGVINAFKPLAETTTVFLHPLNFPSRPYDYGFLDLFEDNEAPQVKLRALPALGLPHYDVMVFISPEYRVDYVRELIESSRPKAVIAWVHNGDSRGALHMPQLHPNVHVFTLAPHVSTFVGNVLKMDVPWVLPLIGLTPPDRCDDSDLRDCLSGFAIQGAMDSRRRNYATIWDQMQVNVIGSGDPKKLQCPAVLCPDLNDTHTSGSSPDILSQHKRVVPHIGLRYLDFYSVIYRNFALIPTLASDSYFDRKFSSTVISSLTTGTPVIVTPRFLEAYTFLNQSTVFLRSTNDEPTMDVAVRVLNMTSQELVKIRRAVVALREQLNADAAHRLLNIAQDAMTRKDLGPSPAHELPLVA